MGTRILVLWTCLAAMASGTSNLTISKGASLPDGNDPAEPGDRIVYTITITSTGSMDATNVQLTDFIDPNTTLLMGSLDITPVARADSFSALGNVSLSVDVTSGLLSNDGDPDGGSVTVTAVQGSVANVGTATPTDKSGLGGVAGTVTVNSDGSVSYQPPPGFVGTDTFSYTVSDDEGDSDSGTVSISISGMVWFLDNGSTAASNGTLQLPFVSIADLNSAQGASRPNAIAGDAIFVAAGAASYTSGLTLQHSQIVVGEGAGATLASIAGLSAPIFSDPLPSTGGSAPLIVVTGSGTNGIDLASDNTVRGLSIGNTGGTGLSGTEVGNLFVREVGISGSGGGVDLRSSTNAAIDVRLDALNATSSSDEGLLLSGVSGDFAIVASNNTITATGIVAVSISGVAGVNLGITLQSVSADGGTNGILLSNTTGSFMVVGDAGNTQNASGGTIQNCSGDGVSLSNCQGVELNQMVFEDTGGHGLSGVNVNGLEINDSIFQRNGDADDEDALSFRTGGSSISGLLTLDNVDVLDFFDTGLYILLDSGTLAVDVKNGSDFTDNDDSFGADAITIELGGSASASVSIDGSSFDAVEAHAVSFTGASATGSQDIDILNCVSRNGGGPDNTASAGGFDIVTGNEGSVTFDIRGCDLRGLTGDGIRIGATTGSGHMQGRIGGPQSSDGNIIISDPSATQGDGIRVQNEQPAVPGTSEKVWTLLVQNNAIGRDGLDTDGIRGHGLQVRWDHRRGDVALTVEDNLIASVALAGIRASFESPPGSDRVGVEMRIVDNTIIEVDTGMGGAGAIDLRTHESIGCFHLEGNHGESVVIASLGPIFLTQEAPFPLEISQGSIPELSQSNNGANVFETGVVGFNGTCTDPRLPSNPLLVPRPLASPAARSVPRSLDTQVQQDLVAPLPFVLTQHSLDPIVSAARARWEAAGLDAERLSVLEALVVEISDLPDWHVGRAARDRIEIDDDAFGWGWFVDPTPLADNEFTQRQSATQLMAQALSPALHRIDLLTAVMHEMGHVLGLDDLREARPRQHLMRSRLQPGVRRLPDAALVESATGEPVAGHQDVDVNLGTMNPGQSVIIEFTVTVNRGLGTATSVDNSATVTADGGITELAQVSTQVEETDVLTFEVGVVGSDLVFNDVNADDDVFTLRADSSGSHYEIETPAGFIIDFTTSISGASGGGSNLVSIPFSAFSGVLIFNAGDGDDLLTLDFSNGGFPATIEFHGQGNGATGDAVALAGGSVSSFSQDNSGAGAGTMRVDGSTLTYTGLE